jgi:hypothetical protein
MHDKTWYPMIIDRNTLNQKQCSNGNVSGRHAHFFNHAFWPVFECNLPEIYQEASAGILPWHLLNNGRGPIFQTHPKPLHNKPYGIICW